MNALSPIIGLLVVSGLVFSSASYFVLTDKIPSQLFDELVRASSHELCDEPCYSVVADKDAAGNFIPQGEESFSESIAVPHNEVFTNLKLPDNLPKKDYQFSGNKATLFAEKDSFIREGIAKSNEGSAKILRVMGIGQTNNRALIAFSQDDIESVASGRDLISATLKLYTASNDGKWNDGQLINVHRLQSNWNEGVGSSLIGNKFYDSRGVSWQCASAINCNEAWNGGVYNEKPSDSAFISNQVLEGYWIKFDVTEDIKDFLTGTANYGWVILKSDEDASGRINFAARETQLNEPELVLVFSQ